MLKINWGKIDKFYIIFVITMVLLAVMVTYTFNGIFSSFIKAYEIGQDDSKLHIRVNKEKLDSVYKFAFERDIVNLELR